MKRIKKDLLASRTVGLPVSHTMARAVIQGHLRVFAPQILDNAHFKCSDRFIRCFLHDELRWSRRTVTRAMQKVPDNWEDKCEDAFLRIAYQALMQGTPAEAILNGDQTGVHPIPLGKYTWAPTGCKQVDGFGKEDKRQFTVLITTTCSGDFLPAQCIWAGKTAASLPTARARESAEADGHIFTSGGEKHWSTFACMKEVRFTFFQIWLLANVAIKYITKIVVPYLEGVREKKRLNKMVGLLIIDCWSVHRGEEFRVWMRTTFGWLRIIFIPGGCM